MTKLSRPSFALLFVASMSVGVVSCGDSGTGTASATGGTAGSGNGGSAGGGSGGGGSNTGGTTGASTGAVGGSGGSGVGGAGGSRTGGSGGSSTGGRGGSGGAAGSSAGGTVAGGSGGGGGSAGTGGAAGSGGTGGRADAGRDVANERFDTGPDLARDTAPIPDAAPVEDGGTCPSGQSACGAGCFDLNTNTSHCGGCATVCASGQSCVGGACVEGGNTAADGCTDVQAANLTLKQIAVYQTVKIPVMQDGNAVATTSRKAPVVAGRTAMFRVFVTLGTGWTARELSARLTLTPAGGTATTYYSKKSVSASSTDADLATSFNVFVPPAAMTAPLTYSVEVVECGAGSGTPGTARFPASGDSDLGVKNTGGLKVRIIPLEFNSLLPDTSATAVTAYADYLSAMYPANNISVSVGEKVTAPNPIDWEDMLDIVQAKRAADKPTTDVYYFGLVKPADSLRTYCGTSCTTGIGFVVTSATGSFSASARVAIGVGFADSTSAQTMAHEIGHNHGREHAPCVNGGTMPDADPGYPYSGGLIGSWGYDYRTQKLFDPAKITDIMGYCNNKWISDYTYNAFATRVAAVNGVTMVYASAPPVVGQWRALWLSDAHAPRWGIPVTEPSPAVGEPEQATIYDSAGIALTAVTAYRTRIAGVNGARLLIPEPAPEWYAVEVAGSPPVPFAP